jgi:hypothetical protein
MKRWARLAILVTLLMGACSNQAAPPTLPSDIREQLHLVSGHEPEQCFNATEGEAIVTLTDDALEPACLMISLDQPLIVRNEGSATLTYSVSSPPGPNVRTVRYQLVLGAGEEGSIDPIGQNAGSAVYPVFVRGATPTSGSLILLP